MRSTLTMALCLVLAGSLSAAPKKSTLDAPTSISCSGDCANASVTWSPVNGAGAYSVEFIAGYDTTGDSVVDVTNNFSYSVAPQNSNVVNQTFSTAFADFEQDFGAGAIAPVALSVHVKAINPPVKKGAQSNPFSAFCNVLDNTTCAPYCHDITSVSGTCIASQVCLAHPIEATSSGDALAACEACNGQGACNLFTTGGLGDGWRSGNSFYYYLDGPCGITAGSITGGSCTVLGRWAP